ncbi:protein-L-isoaspartate(D-aspartate) O-methyltransferase [Nocardiopsis mwathae]|uniref:Protein-L-isoaspartate O-methyltransferase n=1 Tax=Nocardiopsis mwathae TaxID=1472723 RepID=A0A7X0D7D1_9ACTN|nr:methyltransferase domain-containing protein [Nocardiopsis mwathae]MBB6172894.1 protein-L-isoaspartate(D-aspartate) O-methyltransferase [Nocardiopsis mwathae]
MSLVGLLDLNCAIPRGGWRDALTRVPRRLFIPDTIWLPDPDGLLVAVHRDDEAWEKRAASDVAIATQVDDGAPAARHGRGRTATSSASQPSLVLRMLDALDVGDGDRVLEIGTGSGWNAGLLAARLGEDRITSIEVDPEVADQARRNLEKVGLSPHLIVGDGAEGAPDRAPFDRIIATAAVNRVPPAWTTQTRPGGTILTPWGTPYASTGLLRLQVGDDGTAHGQVLGRAGFMWVREQRGPMGAWGKYVDTSLPVDTAKTSVPISDLLDFGAPARFAVGLLVPQIYQVDCHAEDDSGEYTLWLFDAQGSWASVDYQPGASDYPVEQAGPRRLWDEIQAAYQWWVATDRPGRERFGLTVTVDSQQVWLDSPDRPLTPVLQS